MSECCPHGFEHELISGFLDHALTQGDEQRVRIHLEDCRECREMHEELMQLREATMTSDFEVPPDDQWKEQPRGTASGFALGVGWLLAGIWLIGAIGFGLWQFATSPEGLLIKLVVFSGISGVALIFVSVLLDRIQTSKTDRYRGVKK